MGWFSSKNASAAERQAQRMAETRVGERSGKPKGRRTACQ